MFEAGATEISATSRCAICRAGIWRRLKARFRPRSRRLRKSNNPSRIAFITAAQWSCRTRLTCPVGACRISGPPLCWARYSVPSQFLREAKESTYINTFMHKGCRPADGGRDEEHAPQVPRTDGQYFSKWLDHPAKASHLVWMPIAISPLPGGRTVPMLFPGD